MNVQPVTLAGRHVRLEPLGPQHAAGLFDALREPAIWKWLPRGPLTSEADAAAFIAGANAAAADGPQSPFAQIEVARGVVAGTTRYLAIMPEQRTLEVGWTIVGPAWQRTALNTEAKLLLMRHAFETLAANRVQFKTDHCNLPSRQALERLGATFEGILRNHRIRPDGTLRSSAYYSVIAPEWPDVRRRLERLLAQPPRAGA